MNKGKKAAAKPPSNVFNDFFGDSDGIIDDDEFFGLKEQNTFN